MGAGHGGSGPAGNLTFQLLSRMHLYVRAHLPPQAENVEDQASPGEEEAFRRAKASPGCCITFPVRQNKHLWIPHKDQLTHQTNDSTQVCPAG